VVRDIAPPDAAVVPVLSPLLRLKYPPVPVSPGYMDAIKSPPFPPSAAPDAKAIAPELPAVVSPVYRDKPPLPRDPAVVPESWDATLMFPLLVSVPFPLVIENAPPDVEVPTPLVN
jgi:hypothetical protein